MREIHVDRIIEAVRDLTIRACTQLGEAEIKALRHAAEFEVSPTGKETLKIHKEYVHNCNQCWINFHRKYDVVLYRSLEKILPKRFIEMMLGKYQWNENRNTTYSRHLKQSETNLN